VQGVPGPGLANQVALVTRVSMVESLLAIADRNDAQAEQLLDSADTLRVCFVVFYTTKR
jgi:hypothetical protein